MKVVAGALAFTLAGGLLGAGIGWAINPRPVPLPDSGLGFVNYVGLFLGGAVGATFGLVFGGGWVAKLASARQEGETVAARTTSPLPEDETSGSP